MEAASHELQEFLRRENQHIEDEYIRICKRVREDPGTAGDQGEENWKELFEGWLPPYFHIVTKGRIIGISGESSPQVDVIILSPDYPKNMLGCKEYLAGGVVAVFECKTTLRRKHIMEFMQHSKEIKKLAIRETGTPRKELQSNIYYGLLAHSHEWNKETSSPKENITRAIYEFDKNHINHPSEMPDVICVADVGMWKTHKMVIPNYADKKGYVGGTYITPNADEPLYTSVGACVFDLLENIAWKYPSVRELVTYLRPFNLTGAGKGNVRKWSLDVLSEETRANLFRLKNGGFWNEWNISV